MISTPDTIGQSADERDLGQTMRENWVAFHKESDPEFAAELDAALGESLERIQARERANRETANTHNQAESLLS